MTIFGIPVIESVFLHPDQVGYLYTFPDGSQIVVKNASFSQERFLAEIGLVNIKNAVDAQRMWVADLIGE